MGRKRKIDINSLVANTNESSNSSGTSNLSIIQRSAANDRERTRMRVLSKAFIRLKTSLPWVPADTKLSKLDTLKLATSYISYLTKILQDDNQKNNCSTSYSSCNTEIFEASTVNYQKFNVNTRLFTNIRFSSSEKHKKIIEHLSNSSIGVINSSVNVNNNLQNEFCWPFSNNNNNIASCSTASKQIYMNEENNNYMIDQEYKYNQGYI